METVVLSLYSIAYPTITNDIRVDIATQANPNAIVATETDSGRFGHFHQTDFGVCLQTHRQIRL